MCHFAFLNYLPYNIALVSLPNTWMMWTNYYSLFCLSTHLASIGNTLYLRQEFYQGVANLTNDDVSLGDGLLLPFLSVFPVACMVKNLLHLEYAHALSSS